MPWQQVSQFESFHELCAIINTAVLTTAQCNRMTPANLCLRDKSDTVAI